MNENTFLYTLKDIYSECQYHENEMDKGKLEHYAFRHGLEKLNADDAYKVDRYIKKLSSPTVRIRNLGEKAAEEIIGKLGIFLARNTKA